MSGYGAGYGDAGVTGYEDASALGAVTGYGTAAGEARLVTWCTVLDVHALFPFVKTALYTSGIVSSYWYCPHSMWCRVLCNGTVSVHLSVHPPVCPSMGPQQQTCSITAAIPLLQVCCCGHRLFCSVL